MLSVANIFFCQPALVFPDRIAVTWHGMAWHGMANTINAGLTAGTVNLYPLKAHGGFSAHRNERYIRIVHDGTA